MKHLEAHNLARAQPKAFIPLLKRRLKMFIDQENPNVCLVRRGYKIMTHEGVEAVKEAIAFLKTAKPASKL